MVTGLGRLLLVADYHVAKEQAIDLAACLTVALSGIERGAALVQVRAKDVEPEVLTNLGRRLLEVGRAHGCKTVINGNPDIALALGADGVHLTEEGPRVAEVRRIAPEGFLVGRSTHSAASASAAAAEAVDYVVCGPCWATASKPGWQPLGEDGLSEVLLSLQGKAPLFAIGGIGEAEAKIARTLGAYGVAAIRHWLASEHPEATTRALAQAVDSLETHS